MSNLKSKTVAELEYIIKDAGEAAKAMHGHDPIAEWKYADQVNDARTELNRRRGALVSKPQKGPGSTYKLSEYLHHLSQSRAEAMEVRAAGLRKAAVREAFEAGHQAGARDALSLISLHADFRLSI